MQFNRKQIFSIFISTKHNSILTSSDITQMMKNEYLIDKRAFHIIADESSINADIKEVVTAFEESKSIIVKHLEHWNSAIQDKGKALGSSPDVHLYLSPVSGTSFDWHADDRDVFILMQKGEKLFEVEEPDFSISRYFLTEGSELFIPYGARHRAIPSDVISWHLSFGFWPDNLTVVDGYQTLDSNLDLKL